MSRIRSAAAGTPPKKKPGVSAASLKKVQAELAASLAKNNRLANLKKKAAANAASAGSALLTVGETTVSAGASSLLVGAVGQQHRNKARVGRGVSAAVLGIWGLLRTLNGKCGGHQLAFSSGLIAAEASEMGAAYGQQWAAKRAGGVSGAPEIAVTPGASQLGAEARHVLPDNAVLDAFRQRAYARTQQG